MEHNQLQPLEQMSGFARMGKIGKVWLQTSELGFMNLGINMIGRATHNPNTKARAGIYMRQHTKRGIENFYKPYYTVPYLKTPAQETVRGYFRNAVAAWQSLTEGQKNAYNLAAKKYGRSGYHYFLSSYLKNI